MEKITCFRTSDGKIFEDETSACQHEKRLSFGLWYERNKLYSRFDGSIEAKQIEDWLTENEWEIRLFLEALSSDQQA